MLKAIVGLCVIAPLWATSLSGQVTSTTRQADSSQLVPYALYLPQSAIDVERAEQSLSPKLPNIVESKFVYDARNNVYLLSTYYQGRPLSTPLAYTPEEFMRYMARRKAWQNYKHFNSLSGQSVATHRLNPLFDRQSYRHKGSTLERLFGEGGLQFRLSGSVELRAGVKDNYVDNPNFSERARHNTYFDFGQDINAQLRAKLGSKLSLELDYNTEASFASNAKQLRLNYQGEEDDILKLVEAGQVDFKPRNSLVNIGTKLYGVHSQMQFGRLTIDWLFSHQQAERRQIQVGGQGQVQSFDISASDYDEGRHFFLSDFFRSRYEQALANRPYINSGVQIRRIEVWVTNKRGRYDDTRHILAFADLAEHKAIHHAGISPQGTSPYPNNNANSLYTELLASSARDIVGAGTNLPKYRQAWDYDKIESARRLRPEEYVLNERLGYISLNTRLQSDEVLAVAYEYVYEGKSYQVGDFSSDVPEDREALIVKMLKGQQMNADAPSWDYMMRNVYALNSAGEVNVSKEGFKLDIYYHSEAAGTYIPYIPEGQKANERWLQALGLDKLNAQNEVGSDGRFDYLEGLTIHPQKGWIYFPNIAPFAEGLKQAGIEERYHYPELYKQSRTSAKRQAEKNKFQLRGSYQGSTSGLIALGAMVVDGEAVRVQSGGQTLVEGVDYLIDYTAGTLQIINETILKSGLQVEVNIEGERQSHKQRQSILGVDMNYKLSPNLQLGATALYLTELPQSNRLRFGEEAMQNFLWGANLAWHSQGDWLQRLVQKLPLKGVQGNSSISLNIDYAQLHPGSRQRDTYTYIDDFEHSRSEIDLKNPQAWHLSSTPYTLLPPTMSSPLEAGYGRGHLAWFTIDPIFTREHISQTPSYIKANPQLLSSHYVREVELRELFPNREYERSLLAYQPTLNLRFYPRERGMYNLNLSRLGADGYFSDPEQSWGGIMRRLELSDFEAANVEYIEFWLMDPHIEATSPSGGDLYFNIGDISEDILPDGKKFYENGMPIGGDTSALLYNSPWGRVPRQTSIGYAFDNTAGARAQQDVGLDGLSNRDEGQFPSYQSYQRDWLTRFAGQTFAKPSAEAHSPKYDPAGDDFRHYMNSLYDQEESHILERYKYYNGVEGNSREQSSAQSSVSASTQPDVEDINQDNSMSELNRYYEYRVSLRPQDLKVGTNFIVASRSLDITLRNGEVSPVTWYQFRIPLSQYSSAIGGIQDMHSMRFMRMYLRGFSEVVNLRFGTLRLQRGDWRRYTESLTPLTTPSQAELNLSAVNIEEHSDRQPINYILPPGLSRDVEGGAVSQLQANEQALSLQIKNLAPKESQAIYRYVQYDLRRHKRLQMWVHAEQLNDMLEQAEDNDIELFLRLGSDFKNNYYEYSTPLKLTAPGQYNNANKLHRELVWSLDNMLDIDLEALVALKRERNSLAQQNGQAHLLYQAFSRPSGANNRQQMSIVGNPNLSQVQTLMIGVRNLSREMRHAEIWINELRVGEPQHERAYALNANLDIELADFASIQLRGEGSTAGFGGLAQSLVERQREDKKSLNISTSWQIGKLLPEGTKANIPLQVSYSRTIQQPEYSPREMDVKLNDALASASESVRQEIQDHSLRQYSNRSLNLTGLNFGLRSPKPMPYDLGNWTLNFHHFKSELSSPELSYQHQLSWQLGLNYDYNPSFNTLRPFAKLTGKGDFVRYLRQYGLMLWPSRLSLSSSLMRQYEEEQIRKQIDAPGAKDLPPSFLHQFMWYRKLNIQWQLTPNLLLSLQTGTDARIEAPNVQVNRSLNPDDYALWREAVDRSIANMGTPQRYQQQASASYTLPTQSLKALAWINSTANYNSSYEWNLGTMLPSKQESLPNSINNQMSLNLNTQFRLKSLYNLIPKLARIERRINAIQPNSNKQTKAKSSNEPLPNLGDRLLYALMMIKDIQLSVKHNQMTQIPGYLPYIANVFGQSNEGGRLMPGLAFALGLNNEDFIEELFQQGQLSRDRHLALSSVFSQTKVVDLKITLQPIKDLTINLIANHTNTERSEHQYMQEGRPRLFGGDMQMTTIGLRGFFEGLQADRGYSSGVFNQFLNKRSEIQAQLNNDIAPYASGGRLEANSPAVLLPAFRMVYLGQGHRHSKLIPKISAMLPNWTISYNLLGSLPKLSKYFRNLSLRQSYRGIYRINTYDSFANWQGFEGLPLGIVLQDGGLGRVTLREDVASVSLSESFFPLIGADLSFKNGLTLSNQWRRSRNITLSLSSGRLIESLMNEWNISLSYRINDLRSLWGAKSKPISNKRGKPNTSSNKGLTLKLDYSLGRSANLIRQMSTGYSQATAGNAHTRLSISADYELSQLLTLRGYYELNRHRPLVSTSSFPMLEQSYGLSLRLNLSQLLSQNP